MTTPAERIRHALEMCHEIVDLLATQDEQQTKDESVEDALAALAEMEAERDALRAKLDEIERAPTVAWSGEGCVFVDEELAQRYRCVELIARPARKEST